MIPLRSLFIMAIALAMAPSGLAQSTSWLKVYSNFAYTTAQNPVIFNQGNQSITIIEEDEVEIGYMSPAFAFENSKGNVHEFELSRLLVHRRDEQSISVVDSPNMPLRVIGRQQHYRTRISARYGYQFLLFREAELKRVRSYIGFSGNLYYAHDRTWPYVSDFPTGIIHRVGLLVAATPRVVVDVTDRLSIDLNVPFYLGEFSYSREQFEIPTTPPTQNTSTTIGYDTAPKKYMVRLGVGVTI